MENYKHQSVLLNETIKKLDIKPDGIYVDATLGMGGHSKEIAKQLITGRLISFDQDSVALEQSKIRLKEFNNITFIKSNFSNIKEELDKVGISKIDGILYDLGTSYYQLTDEERGFTYHGETKLDMRMDQDQKLTAIDVLNDYSHDQLVDIFQKYGDEPQSRKLSERIIEYRQTEKIENNVQLNKIIKSVKGFNKDKHPSKNIYQAIRIEVNNEIGVIKDSIHQAIELLNYKGKVLVITFHSLEDRTVKDLFFEYKRKVIQTPLQNIQLYRTTKTIYPTKKEVKDNKPSRSSKLRTLIKNHE